MNLYSNAGSLWQPGILKKYFAILLLQLLSTSGLIAQTAKQEKAISLTYKEVSASVLFKALKEQTGHDFNFSPVDVDQAKIGPLEYKNTPLTKVLKDLEQYGLSFHQAGDIISVSYQKPVPKSPNVQAGQGTGAVKGRIVEFETSQPLPGASVFIVELKRGAQSDENGYYRFSGLPAGKYTLQVSFVAFTSENVTINVNSNREATYDVKLQGSNALEEVTVTAIGKTRRPVAHASERQVLEEVKAASVVVSAISSEQISRSADRNAAEVMQRVAGVTTVDDKFVVVRGLNQRYNLTYLNDNVAPSTEVYSRAFALDLIPSRIIDKVLVYKSPSPENQADATGGVVKIYTKDAKMVKHFDIEIQGGWRTGTTFNNNFLTHQGGKYDFLGFDDGLRKLPSVVPAYGSLAKANISQSEYAKHFSPYLTYGQKNALPNMQITANYYNSFKVLGKQLSMLSSLSYKNERQHADVQRKQGLSDLDNVSTENRNNETAQLNLLQNFTYKLRDSSNIQFKNFVLQQGVNTTIVRITHASPIVFFPNSSENTVEKDNILSYSQRFLYAGNLGGTHYYKNGIHKLQWNGGYTFSQQEMPDQRVIRLIGPASWAAIGDTTMQWTARGRNPTSGDDADIIGVTNGIISRLWSRMQEGVYNASVDYSYRYSPWLTLRAGTFHQWKEREMFRRIYTVHEGDFKGGLYSDYVTNPGGYGQYVDPNLIRFPEQQLGQVWSDYYFREDGSGLKVFDRTQGSDAYIGTEQNNSGYASFAFTPLNRLFEVYGGVRVEYNRQKIGAAIPAGTAYLINYPILVDNPTTNFLPSVNASYRPTESWVIRAAYGKTLNRYEFREASPYSEVDYQDNQTIYGNPNLKTATANNYDLRAEFYPRKNARGEMISIGAFYKELKNPIERINESNRLADMLPRISFQNASTATIKGLELEVQKKLDFVPGKLFRDLSLFGNVSLIKSEALKDSADLVREQEENGLDNKLTTIKRPLQGQAPYIVNVGLNYDNAGAGSKISINYNIIGMRIYAAGTRYRFHELANTPEYRGSLMELPRHSLDLAYTQRIINSVQLKFSVQNLLNQPLKMAVDDNYTWKYEPEYDLTDPEPGSTNTRGGDPIASQFNPGRYFILTLSYSL